MNLTQCRMARAALGWSHQKLARLAGVSPVAVNRYLIGHEIPPDEVEKLRKSLEAAGATFEADNKDGTGVRMKHFEIGLQLNVAPSGPATDVVKMMDAAIEEHQRKDRRS